MFLGKQKWAFNDFFLAGRATVKLSCSFAYVVSAIKSCSCSTFSVSVTQIKVQQWYCLREESKLLACFPMLITKQWWQETGAKASSKAESEYYKWLKKHRCLLFGAKGKEKCANVRRNNQLPKGKYVGQTMLSNFSVAKRNSDMYSSWSLYTIKYVAVSLILNINFFFLVNSTLRTLILSHFLLWVPFSRVSISAWIMSSYSVSLCSSSIHNFQNVLYRWKT